MKSKVGKSFRIAVVPKKLINQLDVRPQAKSPLLAESGNHSTLTHPGVVVIPVMGILLLNTTAGQ
jgi:hypothetical protein